MPRFDARPVAQAPVCERRPRFLPGGWRRAAGIAAIAILPASGAAQSPVTRVDIDVRQSGRTFLVDATFSAPVPPSVAWDVLTDFEHMDAFVPNLAESRIVARDGNLLTILQYGIARFGPLAVRFESERQVTLAPFTTIQSTQLRGTMDKLDSITTFTSEGAGTRLTYHVEAIPGALFPDFVARRFLRHEIVEQFEAIVREMVRRHAAAASPSRPFGGAIPAPLGDAVAAPAQVRALRPADATATVAPAAWASDLPGWWSSAERQGGSQTVAASLAAVPAAAPHSAVATRTADASPAAPRSAACPPGVSRSAARRPAAAAAARRSGAADARPVGAPAAATAGRRSADGSPTTATARTRARSCTRRSSRRRARTRAAAVRSPDRCRGSSPTRRRTDRQ